MSTETLEILRSIPKATRPIFATPPSSRVSKELRGQLLNTQTPEVEAFTEVIGTYPVWLLGNKEVQPGRMERARASGLPVTIRLSPWDRTLRRNGEWVNVPPADRDAAREVIENFRRQAESWKATGVTPVIIDIIDEMFELWPGIEQDVLYRTNKLWIMFQDVWPGVKCYWYDGGAWRPQDGYIHKRVHPDTPWAATSPHIYVQSINEAVAILLGTAKPCVPRVSLTGGFMFGGPHFTGGRSEYLIPHEGERGERLCRQLGTLARKQEGVIVYSPRPLCVRWCENFKAFVEGWNG